MVAAAASPIDPRSTERLVMWLMAFPSHSWATRSRGCVSQRIIAPLPLARQYRPRTSDLGRVRPKRTEIAAASKLPRRSGRHRVFGENLRDALYRLHRRVLHRHLVGDDLMKREVEGVLAANLRPGRIVAVPIRYCRAVQALRDIGRHMRIAFGIGPPAVLLRDLGIDRHETAETALVKGRVDLRLDPVFQKILRHLDILR